MSNPQIPDGFVKGNFYPLVKRVRDMEIGDCGYIWSGRPDGTRGCHLDLDEEVRGKFHFHHDIFIVRELDGYHTYTNNDFPA